MKRSERNRNRSRSGGRRIKCPTHGCLMDSRSRKQNLFAHTAEQLKQRGMRPPRIQQLLAQQQAVPLSDEWLEAFWCPECDENGWYHIQKRSDGYTAMRADDRLWQRALGVVPPYNPSVSEFSRQQARCLTSRWIAE
ncbi:hypothetical protein [Gloeobacter kilaueensis]|uniref:Uncharacterized protein n=1 Tax=Gloeobacter kilaueensis (strain ATCC BAA-2537 / CCAP 1431/1 / ULC 316 / JS1) TaxID=1183438 RepID=U5QLT3_GLOK1|nr:hypothetical protein [Gloeobacter kilaueensis]AGY58650.1 hypothetical protein GKIL_2404 [Gloeobacter kilaueensis JS1]